MCLGAYNAMNPEREDISIQQPTNGKEKEGLMYDVMGRASCRPSHLYNVCITT